MSKPVSEKGTYEIFGILRHLYIVRKDQSVMVVHDLPIRSDERLGIERSFACDEYETLKLSRILLINPQKEVHTCEFKM